MVMQNVQLLPMLGDLNHAFSLKYIDSRVKGRKGFAPGQCVGTNLANIIAEPGCDTNKMFRLFIQLLPGGIRESMRSIIYYCLQSRPPVLINFAWAPAYDYELTVWEAVEPAPLRSGITLLLKTRYPDDPHPMR